MLYPVLGAPSPVGEPTFLRPTLQDRHTDNNSHVRKPVSGVDGSYLIKLNQKITLAGKGLSKMCAFSRTFHKMHAFSSNLHKMHAFSENVCIFLKMHAFSWKCAHFMQTWWKCMHFHYFQWKCAHFLVFSGKCTHFQMHAEITKNKFSDIGLASSKGPFFERPKKSLCSSILLNLTGAIL